MASLFGGIFDSAKARWLGAPSITVKEVGASTTPSTPAITVKEAGASTIPRIMEQARIILNQVNVVSASGKRENRFEMMTVGGHTDVRKQFEEISALIKALETLDLSHNGTIEELEALRAMCDTLFALRDFLGKKIIPELANEAMKYKRPESDIDFVANLSHDFRSISAKVDKLVGKVVGAIAEKNGEGTVSPLIQARAELRRLGRTMAQREAQEGGVPLQTGLEQYVAQVNQQSCFTDRDPPESSQSQSVLGGEFQSTINRSREAAHLAVASSLAPMPVVAAAGPGGNHPVVRQWDCGVPLKTMFPDTIEEMGQDTDRNLDVKINNNHLSKLHSFPKDMRDCVERDLQTHASQSLLLPEQWHYILHKIYQGGDGNVSVEMMLELGPSIINNWGEKMEDIQSICNKHGIPLDGNKIYSVKALDSWTTRRQTTVQISPTAVTIQRTPIRFQITSGRHGGSISGTQNKPIGLRLDAYVFEVVPVYRVWVETDEAGNAVPRYELKRTVRLIPPEELKETAEKNFKLTAIKQLTAEIDEALESAMQSRNQGDQRAGADAASGAIEKARQAIQMIGDSSVAQRLTDFNILMDQTARCLDPIDVAVGQARRAQAAANQAYATLITLLSAPSPSGAISVQPPEDEEKE